MIPHSLPPVDAVTEPWWDATRERRLLLQHCPACAAVQHPPRMLCITCGRDDPGWIEAGGTGVVDAATVVLRPVHPGLTPPYVVARVRLAEGPVLLTNIVKSEAGAPAPGAPVELCWRKLADGRHLPVFALGKEGT